MRPGRPVARATPFAIPFRRDKAGRDAADDRPGAGARGGRDVASGAVEVGDGVEAVAANLVRLMVERDPGARQVVEQGFEPLVIKRQPMLHADITPSGADRFIERIVGAGGAELLAVPLAEAADRRVVEQDLADRAQVRLCCGAGRTLGQRVKAADAFDRVAEKIEPQWLRRPRRVEVDDAAAHREFARLTHRVGADVAVVAKEGLQPAEADMS